MGPEMRIATRSIELAKRSGLRRGQQEDRVAPAGAVHLAGGHEAGLHEARLPGQGAQRLPLEARAVHALRVLGVEGAVLGVEIGEGELPAGHQVVEQGAQQARGILRRSCTPAARRGASGAHGCASRMRGFGPATGGIASFSSR